jgi:hypothetical protein
LRNIRKAVVEDRKLWCLIRLKFHAVPLSKVTLNSAPTQTLVRRVGTIAISSDNHIKLVNALHPVKSTGTA